MPQDVGADGGSGAFEVRLLGPVRVLYRGRALELGGVQARSVLAVLMLNPGQVMPRSVIARNAWRGQPPETARELVAHYVSRLRSVLAPAAAHVRVEAVSPGFRAQLSAELIDAHCFTALVRRATQDRAAHEDELAIAHLEQTLALWPRSALALEDVEAEWLRAQADALQEQRLGALEQLAELHYRAGRLERVAELLRDEARHHPQRDALVALLVRALAAAGNGAMAVEAADRAHDALDQLGLPLGPQLREARRHAQRPLSASGSPAAPRQLPPDTGALTGRGRELAQLLDMADAVRRDDTAGALVISAIDGMAGIGKTALAVHAGHRLADRFPDGQLFVDLHGFTQGLEPRTATDVLADVLRTLGVPPQLIPDDLTARAALYRDRLSGKRMLVVLDNANSEEQVRALMPGHPGCLVLVTSRRRLKALDEAQVLSLDTLATPDAVALLRTIAGPGRLPAGDPLLEVIAQLCGNLPLALRIAAALLRHRPSWQLAHLADRLRDTRPGLAVFHDGDRDLAALFDLSYQALDDDQRRLYRRLGLHPGPDIDPYAAAALLSSSPADAERLLEDLIDYSLLLEHAPGRYRTHDLIRDHTRALADGDPEPDRQAAITRLFGYYQHTALRASQPIARTPGPEPTGPEPAFAPSLPNAQAAQRWLRTERANLEAAVDHTHDHARALTAGLTEIMLIDGPWPQAIALHQAAVAAAKRRRDPIGQAVALNDLARTRWLAADHPGATEAVTSALQLARHLDSRHEQGRALATLGRIGLMTSNPRGAADALTQALHTFRDLGNRLGETNMLIETGRLWKQKGDYPGATAALTEGLHLARDHGYPMAQAGALVDLGDAHRLTGQYQAAIDALTQAHQLFRDFSHRFGQAIALSALAEVHLAAGNHPRALDAATQSLQLSRQHGDRGNEAYTLSVHAAVLTAIGDHHEALALYRQALVMNREVGHLDDVATALEGISACLLATGDTHDGAIHLRQALEIYRHLGMQPDIERVQTRLSAIETSRP